MPRRQAEAIYLDDHGAVVWIERDTLVTLKYKQGGRNGQETVQYYRVLGIFSKHYNKWFVELDHKKIKFAPGSKKYKLLVRMMEKQSAAGDYEEVQVAKDGKWSPKAVFRNVYLADVLSVGTKLESDEW